MFLGMNAAVMMSKAVQGWQGPGFLGCLQGGQGPSGHLAGQDTSCVPRFVPVRACQDNVTPISDCFQKEWNPNSKVAVEDWLDQNLDEESKLRMRSIGNIVVPCQAAMGFSILSEVAKLATS